MFDPEVSHKTSSHVHSTSIEQLASDELQSLIQSKDSLDQDFPHSVRHISHSDLWKIAWLRAMERLCAPGPVGEDF